MAKISYGNEAMVNSLSKKKNEDMNSIPVLSTGYLPVCPACIEFLAGRILFGSSLNHIWSDLPGNYESR